MSGMRESIPRVETFQPSGLGTWCYTEGIKAQAGRFPTLCKEKPTHLGYFIFSIDDKRRQKNECTSRNNYGQ